MAAPPTGPLDRHLCQVGGLNLNYASRTGTLYHIQVEDLGPVLDRLSESWARRVNVIVYANYGEPNARIVHGSDRDFEDLRTAEHNRFVEQQIQRLAEDARAVIERREASEVERIKALIREYYQTKAEATKRQFEAANALHPFLFSRAWRELREERARPAVGAPAARSAPRSEARYPLDPVLREQVLEIERMVAELKHDVLTLEDCGYADDILLQTCRKLVQRALEPIPSERPTDFDARRLEKTRASLLTTCRQVKSRLRGTK